MPLIIWTQIHSGDDSAALSLITLLPDLIQIHSNVPFITETVHCVYDRNYSPVHTSAHQYIQNSYLPSGTWQRHHQHTQNRTVTHPLIHNRDITSTHRTEQLLTLWYTTETSETSPAYAEQIHTLWYTTETSETEQNSYSPSGNRDITSTYRTQVTHPLVHDRDITDITSTYRTVTHPPVHDRDWHHQCIQNRTVTHLPVHDRDQVVARLCPQHLHVLPRGTCHWQTNPAKLLVLHSPLSITFKP